jgi:hypothetical protein
VAIVPLGERAVKQEALFLGLAANDAAIADPVPMGVAELSRHDDLVFWGSAGQLGVRLGDAALARTAALARLSALLAARRASGRPAVWVRRRTGYPERPDSPGEKAVAALLRALATTTHADDLLPALGMDAALPAPAPRETAGPRGETTG